jgi:tight adherence protein C
MLPVITALTFFLIASLTFFLLYLFTRRKENITHRLAKLSGASSSNKSSSILDTPSTRVERFFEPISKLIPKSPHEVGTTRKKLYSAGFTSGSAATVFFGIKAILIIGLPLILWLSGITRGMSTQNAIIMFSACILGGYIIPDFVLSTRVTARRERIQLALPDALDLLVVCVEAGLGLDQAIMKTSDELYVTHPDICDELAIVNLELRAGKPRREALKNLADRTGVEDINGLVSMLIQTDRFGTSIATSLRVHSDAMRTKRRQRAEEKAHKVAVKMVFPLVFLVFPSMFVVILGPGALTIYNVFIKGGF